MKIPTSGMQSGHFLGYRGSGNQLMQRSVERETGRRVENQQSIPSPQYTSQSRRPIERRCLSREEDRQSSSSRHADIRRHHQERSGDPACEEQGGTALTSLWQARGLLFTEHGGVNKGRWQFRQRRRGRATERRKV